MTIDFKPLLLGKDLRTLSRSNEAVRLVNDQQSFDELFKLLFHHERTLVMRAADAVEKVTRSHSEYLQPHKQQFFLLLKSSIHIETKWHIAQLIPRLNLSDDELKEVWNILSYWVQNPNESKIVRVNSLQGLFELSQHRPELKSIFEQTMRKLEKELVPSIQARIRKLKKLAGNKQQHVSKDQS